MKKKIAIIAPGRLPVPAVQGGGIEQLIDNLIRQNELTPQITIHLISAYSPLTKKLEENYSHTKFHHVKYSFLRRCFNYFDREISSKILKYPHHPHDIRQIMKFVKQAECDKVVIYGNDRHIQPLAEIVEKERLIYIMATLMLTRLKDFSLCKRIFVGSNHSKLSVLNQSDKLTENDIRIVQEGIDTDYFSPAEKTKKKYFLRNKYKIDKEIPIVCYLGRLDVSKGVLILLQAALSIKDSVPFKLILIGSFGLSFGSGKKGSVSEEELEIKKCIEDLGEHCITTGFVRNDQVIDYLADVDVGVVPSICEDVSPLTYFEFQALGIPTIVSDGGGIPEYFSSDYSLMFHRGTNMVNDLATCLKEVVNNKEMREKMSSTTLRNREYLGIQRFYNDFVDKVFEA